MSNCRCPHMYFETPKEVEVPLSLLDNTVPEEILGKIFRFIPHDYLDNVSNVSTRWADIVDRYTRRLLIIKNQQGCIVDYESTFDKLSIKGNFWVSLARENENPRKSFKSKDKQLEEGDDGSAFVSVKENLQVPVIVSPDSVRKLGFVGILNLNVLDGVLSSCKNITGLYLHFSVFVKMLDGGGSWNSCMESYFTPNLKELVIDCCGTTSEEVGSGDGELAFNFKHAFCSLYVFLLKKEFPSLEKFVLSVPYVELWDGQLVFAVSTFLGKHAETLRRFSYSQKYELTEDEYNDFEISNDACKDPNKVPQMGGGDCIISTIAEKNNKRGPYADLPPQDTNYLSLKQLAVCAKELKKVSLEDFHITLIRSQESAPVWKNFLIQQQKQDRFKKLIFVGDKIPCPSKTIEVNALTLVTVRLDVRDLVDLECFKDCKGLKYLTLRGKADLGYADDDDEDKDDDDDDEGEKETVFQHPHHHNKDELYSPPVQLKNAKSLPHSLECVEIVNLRTDKDDVSFLAIILPNLRDLTLINVGWEGRLGLRLGHLVLIWQQHRLEHFCIKASLNMMSYSELDGDQMYPINLLGCVIQSNSFTAASRFSLEVWKNEQGAYAISGSLQKMTNALDDDDIDVFKIPNKSQTLLNEDDGEESESEYEDSDCSSTSRSGSGSAEEEEEYGSAEDENSDNWEEEKVGDDDNSKSNRNDAKKPPSNDN